MSFTKLLTSKSSRPFIKHSAEQCTKILYNKESTNVNIFRKENTVRANDQQNEANSFIRLKYNNCLQDIQYYIYNSPDVFSSLTTNEEIARFIHFSRNYAKKLARDEMPDKNEVKQLEERNLKKYGDPLGPRFEDMVQEMSKKNPCLPIDQIYIKIIQSGERTSQSHNDAYSVNLGRVLVCPQGVAKHTFEKEDIDISSERGGPSYGN